MHALTILQRCVAPRLTGTHQRRQHVLLEAVATTVSGPRLTLTTTANAAAGDKGWLSPAVVLDLYSRKVVGYALADHIRAELVCDALKAALGQRGTPSGVLVHSDRGSQYCSHEYQNLLDGHGLIPSLSRRGNGWDHAPTERFFHSLKLEAMRDESLMTHRQLRHLMVGGLIGRARNLVACRSALPAALITPATPAPACRAPHPLRPRLRRRRRA